MSRFVDFWPKALLVKFIYSEKATKFWEISSVDLSYVVSVKSTVKILQNFVSKSGYINGPLNSNLNGNLVPMFDIA